MTIEPTELIKIEVDMSHIACPNVTVFIHPYVFGAVVKYFKHATFGKLNISKFITTDKSLIKRASHDSSQYLLYSNTLRDRHEW